ncbi:MULTISPECIES: hypothetical protein [Sphingomonas]|uniref:Uncharacterized protein n=1 Tax=Sphingomonas mollis TaxID=2795726 RepID=A0ABS0XSY8_9SPHN|nr:MULTISPECIES: hypothetical protein [unclassified Sphingomonas]KQU62623.1 hypothetical protein ASG67_04145 [Sphingomonas sp. Leaf339]MBJ6123156.1 hypothetical protein [Sphingomonas sp. BT553]
MADERIVTDTGTQPHTTIIERRSGGGGMLIAIVLLIAVVIGGFYLFGRQGAENRKDAAITSAAKSVGGAADKVGDAVGGEKK